MNLLQKTQAERRASIRLQNKRNKRKKWLLWAIKHVQQRGKYADSTIFCGQGQHHLVGPESFSIGNGTAFKSLACSGCLSGRNVLRDLEVLIPKETIEETRQTTDTNLTSLLTSPCMLCQQFYVITSLKVFPNDIVGTIAPTIKTDDSDLALSTRAWAR